jgi:hypothetical protein
MAVADAYLPHTDIETNTETNTDTSIDTSTNTLPRYLTFGDAQSRPQNERRQGCSAFGGNDTGIPPFKLPRPARGLHFRLAASSINMKG